MVPALAAFVCGRLWAPSAMRGLTRAAGLSAASDLMFLRITAEWTHSGALDCIRTCTFCTWL
jgi:hypothetical protein